MADSMEGRPIQVPGFGLPLNHLPEDFFPAAVLNWEAVPITVRERCMLCFINEITDKPDWSKKVFEKKIVGKWKAEAVGNLDWEDKVRNGDFTTDMFDYCIRELRDKAKFFDETGLVVSLDTDACIVKSDTAVPEELREALKKAAAPLENVPDNQKDWHPGSDEKVLNLVHPSLFPVIYGRTRVLVDGIIGLDNCLDQSGSGKIVPVPGADQTQAKGDRFDDMNDNRTEDHTALWSGLFQWLPCEVTFDGNHNASIVSYVNNLHPKRHADLYTAVERLITKTLPLWNTLWRLTRNKEWVRERCGCDTVLRVCTTPDLCEDGCFAENRPQYEWEDEDDRDEDLNDEWYEQAHPVRKPNPNEYVTWDLGFQPRDVASDGSLLEAAKGRLQVIVKLANIHLTPEKPSYGGGSWHVEGQLNEHICATALYYYDNENITNSYLDFQTPVDDRKLVIGLNYEQSDYDGIDAIFDAVLEEPSIQPRGSILTREGRLLAFPNIFQHQVQPFELVDSSKPGHRKIVALFLVDPAVHVLSSANVPPQQQAWWSERFVFRGRLGRLPPEVTELVVDGVDFPISLEEAKKARLQLIEERGNVIEVVKERLSSRWWNFCEH